MTAPTLTPASTAVSRLVSRLVLWGGLALLALLPVAVLVGWLAAGVPGAWGAGLGLGVPVAFFGVTSVVALLTSRTRPETLGVVLLGSWVLKLAVLVAFMWWVSAQDFYSRPAFFVAFVVGTVGFLTLDALVVLRSRTPYVEPRSTP